MASQPSSTTADSIPDDALWLILLRLPSAASLARAALVSRSWCRITSEGSFIKDFRRHHPSSPLLGFFTSDLFFETACSVLESPELAAPLCQADTALARFERDQRIQDCRNGQLLLSRDGNNLCIYDPLSRRRVPISPRTLDDHDGENLDDCLLDDLAPRMVRMRQRGQWKQAEESFRVVSLQRRRGPHSRSVRPVEYDPCKHEQGWHGHQWVQVQSVKLLSKAMYAANHIFWRTNDALLLVLDTSTMRFSEQTLPSKIDTSRCAIGALQDDKTCLVCLQGLNITSDSDSSIVLCRHLKVSLEVWALEEEEEVEKKNDAEEKEKEEGEGKKKMCWKLKQSCLVSQICKENARVCHVNKVINGLAVISGYGDSYAIDLQTMTLLTKFKSGGDAYPYQMPWPCVLAAATSFVSSHLGVNLSNEESAQIRSNNRDGQEGTSSGGSEPDIAPVLPEGEECESGSGSRKKSDESSMHLEESCNPAGFKLDGEGDHEAGNLHKYHDGAVLQSENVQFPEMETLGSTSSVEALLDSMLNSKDKDVSHLIKGIQTPLVSTEVHNSQTPLNSEQQDISEKSSQDMHGVSARIQPMDTDPVRDELTLQMAGVFPSVSCVEAILEGISESDNLPKNNTEDTEMLEQENSGKAHPEGSCTDKVNKRKVAAESHDCDLIILHNNCSEAFLVTKQFAKQHGEQSTRKQKMTANSEDHLNRCNTYKRQVNHQPETDNLTDEGPGGQRKKRRANATSNACSPEETISNKHKTMLRHIDQHMPSPSSSVPLAPNGMCSKVLSMEGEDTSLAAASVVKDGIRLVERSKVAETAPSAAAVESVTISTTAVPQINPGLSCQDSSMRQSPATTQGKPTKKSRRKEAVHPKVVIHAKKKIHEESSVHIEVY
ncbi:hypothetical protein ACQJBY_000434 [Aegilops geniculata]